MINPNEVLPLTEDQGFSRDISITSCRLNESHIQVRGQLTDTRRDFEDHQKQIVVHCLVVRMTVNLESNTITKAEFGLPKMAFSNLCEHLPAGPEHLEGLNIFKGLSFKIRELYSGKRSCFHLSSLLLAMVPALTQCRSWNADFKDMDEKLPASAVPKAMHIMQKNVKNSCHAWEETSGKICSDFRNGHYERMLERMAPRLLGRWQQHETEQDNQG